MSIDPINECGVTVIGSLGLSEGFVIFPFKSYIVLLHYYIVNIIPLNRDPGRRSIKRSNHVKFWYDLFIFLTLFMCWATHRFPTVVPEQV